MTPNPASARTDAGFSIEQAARKLGKSPKYLRSLECSGAWPYPLAAAASRLYGVRIEAFLSKPGFDVTTKKGLRAQG